MRKYRRLSHQKYFQANLKVLIFWAVLGYVLSLCLVSSAKGNTLSNLSADSIRNKVVKTEQINTAYDCMYMQNTRPASAGWEFFDPIKTLLVADVNINFVLFNSPRSRFFFFIDPRVNLRLFAAQGAPVKSPSYMPNGTLDFRISDDTLRPHFLSVAYSHHSNGVRGPTLNPDGTFNVGDGKFTTNFYTLTYHTGQETQTDALLINRYTSLGLELHTALIGLGYSHALKDKYGFVRLNGDYLYTISPNSSKSKDKKCFYKRQSIELSTVYIMDKYDDYNTLDIKKRLNILLKYYYQLPFMRNASIMMGGGYRGQDEYNIFFQSSYAYLTVGLASGLSF
jgi:hypothetical protein